MFSTRPSRHADKAAALLIDWMVNKPQDTRAIESRILVLRGQRVMLDADLAQLYAVKVKALNQAVRRNADRFPDDFMFQLESDEADSLRSQFVTLDAAESRRGRHSKHRPYAFRIEEQAGGESERRDHESFREAARIDRRKPRAGAQARRA